MGKDSDFKENFEISAMTKLKIKSICFNGAKVYSPDLIFYDDKNFIVLEQSSNSDRKIHIAELTQFIEGILSNRFSYKDMEIKNSHRKFTYILILTPNGTTELNKKTEANRLRCYWGFFKKLDNTLESKINFIGVTDFESLNKTFTKIELNDLIKVCESV
ncbi:hypothetical protein ACSW87_04905 [Clostridium perfringens]